MMMTEAGRRKSKDALHLIFVYLSIMCTDRSKPDDEKVKRRE